MLAEVIGPDILVILVVLALLFGGSQLPKLARSLGTARSEFEKGLKGGAGANAADTKPAEATKAPEAPTGPGGAGS